MVTRETDGFSATLCLPSTAKCTQQIDLDAAVKVFGTNGWKMMPMFTCDGMSDVSEQTMKDYVDLVDWFLDRYHTQVSIPLIELVNNPGSNWKGTAPQLVNMTNAVYEHVKTKYPETKVTTPGFEYWPDDLSNAMLTAAIPIVEYYLDKANGAKFDVWAVHGYPVWPSDALMAKANEVVYYYPPTKTAMHNKYAGLQGMAVIRNELDANGWSDRQIMDTEQWAEAPRDVGVYAGADPLLAAFLVEDMTVERTLQVSGKPVLMGANVLLVLPHGSVGIRTWGSLDSDMSTTQHLEAVGRLLSYFDRYRYDSHVSGRFDNDTEVWVEKFVSPTRTLFIIFKPFEYVANEELHFDGKKIDYSLVLASVPKSVTVTDAYGASQPVPAQGTLTVQAENVAKYVEVVW